MVLGFSGWMNGGEVSTGAVNCLIRKFDAQLLAEIDPEGFYISSFPGSMQVSALFRPHTKIEDGRVTAYQGPSNRFYCCQEQRLILFLGKEPNLRWAEFAECFFSIASRFGVSAAYFIGSVAGLVPHTRDPRLHSSVSEDTLRPALQQLGVRFSNYDGPASISTYLTVLASRRGLPMATLVAEIPAYVQGENPRCVEAVTRRLAAILALQPDLDDLHKLGERLEQRINAVVEQRPELLERIRSLERDYDNEVFDTGMDDLKEWLERQGIRLD
jgi:proteasome assembly chaperone (PAC2) family protein